jgi:hypothetical protein
MLLKVVAWVVYTLSFTNPPDEKPTCVRSGDGVGHGMQPLLLNVFELEVAHIFSIFYK